MHSAGNVNTLSSPETREFFRRMKVKVLENVHLEDRERDEVITKKEHVTGVMIMREVIDRVKVTLKPATKS
jgi:hypothetical protein